MCAGHIWFLAGFGLVGPRVPGPLARWRLHFMCGANSRKVGEGRAVAGASYLERFIGARWMRVDVCATDSVLQMKSVYLEYIRGGCLADRDNEHW